MTSVQLTWGYHWILEMKFPTIHRKHISRYYPTVSHTQQQVCFHTIFHQLPPPIHRLLSIAIFVTDKWMAPWKNRICPTTVKMRKSLVKPVTLQNISSCLVLPPEIVIHDAFNDNQWSNCKIRARRTLSVPFPLSPFLFPYPFLPLPLPFISPPIPPLRSRPLKSS